MLAARRGPALATVFVSAVLASCGGDEAETTEAPEGSDPAAVAEAWSAAVAEGDYAGACEFVVPPKPGQASCEEMLDYQSELESSLPGAVPVLPTAPGTAEDVSIEGEPGHVSGDPSTVLISTPDGDFTVPVEQVDGEWKVNPIVKGGFGQ